MYLIPAIRYKDEIIKASDALRYSDNMMHYNGCMEHGRIDIQDGWDNGGRYQWAIVDKYENLVGYISYEVDHFARAAYSFGLIAFREDPEAKRAMAMGILEAIRHIEAMHLHRIEFRCVWDNPACTRYESIIKLMVNKHGYMAKGFRLTDVFRDEYGEYHDCVIFELIDNNE